MFLTEQSSAIGLRSLFLQMCSKFEEEGSSRPYFYAAAVDTDCSAIHHQCVQAFKGLGKVSVSELGRAL